MKGQDIWTLGMQTFQPKCLLTFYGHDPDISYHVLSCVLIFFRPGQAISNYVFDNETLQKVVNDANLNQGFTLNQTNQIRHNSWDKPNWIFAPHIEGFGRFYNSVIQISPRFLTKVLTQYFKCIFLPSVRLQLLPPLHLFTILKSSSLHRTTRQEFLSAQLLHSLLQ